MSFDEKLNAAKDKAALREFEVTITETLEKVVTVTAANQCEAELLVNGQWDDSRYILTADDFTGVKFNAVPVTPVLPTRGEER